MAIFTDFKNKFTIHPNKKALDLVNDADSVKQSIKNLINSPEPNTLELEIERVR